MTLQLSGAISLSDINVELGKAANTPCSLGDADLRVLAGVPSGAISLSNFYGKSSVAPPTISVASVSGPTVGGPYYVNYTVGGTAPVTTAGAWISGASSYISASKMSTTQWQFNTLQETGARRIATYRVTASNSAGSAYVDRVITLDELTGGGSCFVAGSLVTMADGSMRRIETIAVGDWVKTAVGVAQVSEMYLPLLGERTLYAMQDGKCITSGEHSMWTRDPATNDEWWATRDMEQWRMEAVTGTGPNFNGHEPYDLTSDEGSTWSFATENGWVDSTWHEIPGSPDTQLYHLLLEEGGSYFVDGYLVSSIADTGGVDWENFSWSPSYNEEM